jgi:hypothetical protein
LRIADRLGGRSRSLIEMLSSPATQMTRRTSNALSPACWTAAFVVVALGSLATSAQASTPATRSAETRAPRSVIVSDDLVQTVYWIPGEEWIRIENRERTPDGTWERVQHEFETSFEVDAVDGRQTDEFYVAGRTRTGEDVLEKWSFETQTGGRFFSIAAVSTPIGKPAAAVPTTRSGLMGGGSYVPVADRPSIPKPIRRELYRGNAFSGAVDLSADPEGRFVIVLANHPRAIHRVPIETGVLPSVLYTTDALPALAHADGIHRRQHSSFGRVYVLRGGRSWLTGARSRLLLVDRDNDGAFEKAETWSDSEYAKQPWLTDFTTYTSSK